MHGPIVNVPVNVNETSNHLQREGNSSQTKKKILTSKKKLKQEIVTKTFL